MTREEAITAVKEVTGMSLSWNDRHYEALQMALTALSAQTDGDVISRQVAIDALKPLPTIEGLSLQPLITVDDVIKVLNGLPSAQPERKPGKWLMDGEKCGELMWRCSECKVSEVVPTATSFVSGITYPQWRFCPNCGAKMEGGDEE